MELCPECHRRLLSQASTKCNWCGHTIDDTGYQARAEQERQAYFAEIAARDALDHLRLDAGLNPFRDARQDLMLAAQIAQAKAQIRTHPVQPAASVTKPAPPPVEEPETEPGNRFQHLEF